MTETDNVNRWSLRKILTIVGSTIAIFAATGTFFRMQYDVSILKDEVRNQQSDIYQLEH